MGEKVMLRHGVYLWEDNSQTSESYTAIFMNFYLHTLLREKLYKFKLKKDLGK